ncbi:hypothetical protein SAMN05192580_0639 [Sphingomonas jatrophae]|uniref:Uncharacterized protein n=1 Tax=Sphingomonas jatrophae TaxID=1166337 RepID=A0A1I6JQV4_9SPHN|nr:hypothetical protein SAMN05192580_0639 [Sphingomonas jatrophae]
MVVLASTFFFAVAAGSLWLMIAMFSANGAAIVRALRMQAQPDVRPTPPAARVTRVRRSIRTRSAVAPAQWRAAA